ncbi:hypothetical protein BD410DRAFT_784117 [Rickenella mellea]|uniref:Uncharacterized protein n=1 Tax=Rickenella mellea TaxID=50990 RepID=A0A4Y7QEN5_9AGAM|nr:hypothetical protein BD410DRAFT_784117 [Rickenella mellea]
MPLVSTLRPLVSTDPPFPADRAVHSVTRSDVLGYTSSKALKNYDNCANCATSKQACITGPPYSPTLCRKCSKQGRTKCPPHMSTTEAALWKKKDKEKRSKKNVTGTVDKVDDADTEAFNPKETRTSIQPVTPEESTSNQSENVIECKLSTVTSRPVAQQFYFPSRSQYFVRRVSAEVSVISGHTIPTK